MTNLGTGVSSLLVLSASERYAVLSELSCRQTPARFFMLPLVNPMSRTPERRCERPQPSQVGHERANVPASSAPRRAGIIFRSEPPALRRLLLAGDAQRGAAGPLMPAVGMADLVGRRAGFRLARWGRGHHHTTTVPSRERQPGRRGRPRAARASYEEG